MESHFVPSVTDFLKGTALFDSFEASPARPYGNIMSLRRVWSTRGMILTGEAEVPREKPVSFPLCSPEVQMGWLGFEPRYVR